MTCLVTSEAYHLASSNPQFPITRVQTSLGYRPRVQYEEAMQEIEKSLKG